MARWHDSVTACSCCAIVKWNAIVLAVVSVCGRCIDFQFEFSVGKQLEMGKS